MFGFLKAQDVPQIDGATLEQRIKGDAPPTVLDVREPFEVSRGHIPGALLIPMGQVMARKADLPTDREIVVVCASGARSAAIARQLKNAGLEALNLRGGMHAWRGPVTR